MIRAVIIDDEPLNISNLKALLNLHCPIIEVVGSATNFDLARLKILELNPEVIFLDIQMPGKSGFDLLKSFEHHPFEVVFVTAFDEYGIMAIKFSALDYLLKPISIPDLKAAVSKIEKVVASKTNNLRLENLFHLLNNKRSDDNERIALPTLKETHFIPIKEIIRCESSNNYTTFYLKDGASYIISKPIYEYETMLSAYGFIRCHQSHLVNKAYIKSLINEDSGYLIMENTLIKIPVSRQKRKHIKSFFI